MSTTPAFKVLDVVVNTLTGELAQVMSVSAGRAELRDKTGEVSVFKIGPHLALAEHDRAVDFRAMLHTLRRSRLASEGKRKPFTAESILKRLAKKRR
jgi:hypothetical protein